MKSTDILLVSYFLFLIYCRIINCRQNKVAFWFNVKPYLFIKDGKVEGILNDIIEKTNIYCSKYGFDVTYTNDSYKKYTSFFDAMESNFTYTLKDHINNNTDIVWFPVMSPHIHLLEKTFALQTMFKASGAVVIVKRDLIKLSRKIYLGVYKATNLVVLCMLLTVGIGILVWALVCS